MNPQIPFSEVYCNTPYEKKQLSTSVLHSGQGYQRPVKMHVIKKIIKEFDPKVLDEIVVSFRDGKFYVVDGQHRITALKEMNGGHECMVNCKIIADLTYEQEADLYEKLDKSKTKLNIADRTRAKSEAGEYQDIADIEKVLAANSIEWVFSTTGVSGTNKVSATRTLLSSYDQLGFDEFQRVIHLIKETWCGDKQSLNRFIISGVSLFFKTYGTGINDRTFVRQLSKVPPQEILSEGKTDSITREMALKYARVIWSKYNYKQRVGLLEYRFNG